MPTWAVIACLAAAGCLARWELARERAVDAVARENLSGGQRNLGRIAMALALYMADCNEHQLRGVSYPDFAAIEPWARRVSANGRAGPVVCPADGSAYVIDSDGDRAFTVHCAGHHGGPRALAPERSFRALAKKRT